MKFQKIFILSFFILSSNILGMEQASVSDTGAKPAEVAKNLLNKDYQNPYHSLIYAAIYNVSQHYYNQK